jgi:RNA-directed DNA polymerase
VVGSSRQALAQGLAGAFLAGPWDPPAMALRGQRAVGQRRVWVRDLAVHARWAYPEAPRDRPRELTRFLADCPPLVAALDAAVERGEDPPRIHRWFSSPTEMATPAWPVVGLDTVGDLADLLGLRIGHLHWFADTRSLERLAAGSPLGHYRYRWVGKANGGARLIEEPKPVLKHLQRVVLREILEHVPSHPAAHGFVPGRSARTYAAVHTGRAVVFHLDLEDFFGSVTAGRVYGIFRTLGYAEPVAHVLTSLVTNAVPHRVRRLRPAPPPEQRGTVHRLERHLAGPHLPQGSPTAPALANLAAHGLDRRLAALADGSGLRYSRYADDLALSAPGRRGPARCASLVRLVTRIATEEGFRINEAKSTVRTAGQHQRLAGIVVNDHPNLDRREFDRLKATLTNTARLGPDSQNRIGHANFRDHLTGRVAWVEHLNPGRGRRLRVLLETIEWPGTG